MNVPTFAEEVRREMRRCLFGTEGAPSRVVLTPIPSFFEPLRSLSPPLGGWWPSAARGHALAVLVPQATAVLDAVCCLAPGTEVVLAGLAGSAGSVEVGAAVEAKVAVLEDERLERTSTHPLRFPPVAVGHVRCLADSVAGPPREAAAVDCFDMETALVYAAAHAAGLHATALLVVSDAPPERPYFRVGTEAWRARIGDVSDAIADFLEAD